MSEAVRERVVIRLRALMSRTVANGCTPEEELSAARMVAKVVEQLDAMDGLTPDPKVHWAQAERQSPEYQSLLEKNVTESLFKSALLELAMAHLNMVAPPRRRLPGDAVQVVRARDILEPHLTMVLGLGGSRLARDIMQRELEELTLDGMLPERLSIPLE